MSKKARKKKAEEYDGSTKLKSVMMEAYVSNIIAGMVQYKAFEAAGYKSNTPRNGATQLQTNTNVMVRLAYKRAQLAKKLDISAERITRERAKIGFVNMGDFLDEEGRLRPLNEVSRDNLATVSSVKFDGAKVEFTLHNKQVALDGLCKQLGLYEKDNTQKRSLTVVEILAIVESNKAKRLKTGDMPVIEGETDV